MSRLQRRFTSDVSHELRTPLTTVRMAADLIFAERDEFDPAVARSAELLQAELDRFEEPAHRPAGDQPVRRRLRRCSTPSRPTWCRSCDGSPSGCAALAERVGVADRAATCRTDPVIAEVDPRRVERMLRNLVGNAVEHGEGRPVEVTLGADEPRRRGHRARPRRRAQAGRGEAGLQPVLAGRPVPGPADRRHRAWACRSAWRTPGCTAAGWRRGARPARAPSSGSRCRSAPATG